jgi:F0F1-type ATP synthase gamma subunit
MNVKAVVKVMNFHALLRVDASGRKAVMYNTMEQELTSMMRILQSNRNLRLDKHIRIPDVNLPVLRIYMGSDLGFCGSINTSVSSVLMQDARTEKIVIGRKLHRPAEVSLYLSQEEYQENFGRVREYLERAVRSQCWSAVEIVYNHYYNVTAIKPEVKRIYPLADADREEADPEEAVRKDLGREVNGRQSAGQKDTDREDTGKTGSAQENEWDDFEIEGDAQRLLEDMTISCMVYEVHIAAASAYAAENIMRQNATSESLKKLDEIEAETTRLLRKQKNQAAFQKTIDSFVKQKALRGKAQ